MSDFLSEWKQLQRERNIGISPVSHLSPDDLKASIDFFRRVSREASSSLARETAYYLKIWSEAALDDRLHLHDENYAEIVSRVMQAVGGLLETRGKHRVENGKDLYNDLERIALYYGFYQQRKTIVGKKYGKGKLIGSFLRESGAVTHDQLLSALDEQRSSTVIHTMIGEILLEKGIITRQQLDHAIELQMMENMAEKEEG